MSNLNKQMILDYHDLTFNKHKPEEALEKYISQEYIQHNPYSDGRRSSFVSHFKECFRNHPQFKVSVINSCADKDYVFLHVHTQNYPGDSGEMVVEIYKIKNLKIVEHWDVIQKVKKDVPNPNAYF